LMDRLNSYSLALENVFNYWENHPTYRPKYPHLKDSYLAAIAELQKTPIKLEVNGKPYFINAQDGLYLLRRKLYEDDAFQQIPSLILALKKREGTILKPLIQYEKRFLSAINLSMLLSVERYESFDPLNTVEAINAYYKKSPLLSAKLGFFTSFYLAGKNWHQASLPAAAKTFQPSAIPTLLTVNRYDPITPPENAFLFKKELSNARLLILDESGHAGGNIHVNSKIMAAFMDKPTEELDTSCLNVYHDGD